tara:strand:- start:277 stop:576 length:300 start_codon:yes stop_codon:yes gene_type:complete
MAVQQLAKDQAKREKKNQKNLDEQFKKDDEKAEKDAERYMDLMDRIYKKDETPRYENLEKTLRKYGVEAYGAKKGGLMKKCGVQMKGTSPLIKKRKGKK